jgi:hypothetical protein
MNWYKFDSLEEFDVWHLQVMTILGLPKPSSNSEGVIQKKSVITNAYTLAFIVSENDIRAMSEEIYAEGLTPSVSPFPPRSE